MLRASDVGNSLCWLFVDERLVKGSKGILTPSKRACLNNKDR